MNNNQKRADATRKSFFSRLLAASTKGVNVNTGTKSLIPSFLIIKKETVSRVSDKVTKQGE